MSLLAGAVLGAGFALALYWSSGAAGTQPVEATQGGSYTAHLSIDSCTGPCTVPISGQFTVAVNMDTWTAPYDGLTIDVISSTGDCKSANTTAMTTSWAHRFDFSGCISATEGELAASKGVTDSSASQKGKVGEFVFNCTQSGTLSLDASSFVVNSSTGGSDPIVVPDLAVNCLAPTSTPSGPSASPTPTQTPTAIPTTPGTPAGPTPPVGVQKCVERTGSVCTSTTTKFLTIRKPQGLCNQTSLSEAQILWERLTTSVPAGVAAFQLEIRYDAKLVCVGVIALPPKGTNPFTCFVLDDIHNPPGPIGTARIGCVTVGKGDQWNPSAPLAVLGIALQPDQVKLLTPGQNNGIHVQIIDQDCNFADEQGKPIPAPYCANAELTFQFLEGDVVTNCRVDASDVQDIAFRWNARQQNLLYDRFRDLVPAGGDGVIDIQDLQFVYGRFGSTCDRPWPPK